jgi:hypothetical protein
VLNGVQREGQLVTVVVVVAPLLVVAVLAQADMPVLGVVLAPPAVPVLGVLVAVVIPAALDMAVGVLGYLGKALMVRRELAVQEVEKEVLGAVMVVPASLAAFIVLMLVVLVEIMVVEPENAPLAMPMAGGEAAVQYA